MGLAHDTQQVSQAVVKATVRTGQDQRAGPQDIRLPLGACPRGISKGSHQMPRDVAW